MSELKDKALASLDRLLTIAEILLKNITLSNWDKGDSAMGAISVMQLALLHSYGPMHPVAQQLFPAVDCIQSRIRDRNYIGAGLDAEYLIKALKEIRTIIEDTKEQ